MTKLIRPFLLLLFMSFAPALRAQVEVYPYAGLSWSGEAYPEIPLRDEFTLNQRGWMFGAEVLLGGRRLAPLFGLVYESDAHVTKGAFPLIEPLPDPKLVRISQGNYLLPQLGLAYRVRPPDASLNLLLLASATLETPLDRASSRYRDGEYETTILPRIGVKLTLDYVVIGLDYYGHYRGDSVYHNQYPSRLALTLGGRF